VVLGQVRKPWGWPGRLFLWAMRFRHAGVTAWGLGRVSVGKTFSILDVGCGSGATVRNLANAAREGKVCGLDYSATSVAAAKRLNAELIVSGRVDIQQGSVSNLPFDADTFDLVTAVETHYYWPHPVADLREILRVLRPGGRLVVIAEQYKGERFGALFTIPMKVVGAAYLTVSEHRELLGAAGFIKIDISVETRRGWICCVGEKAVEAAA
jgi:ubiquinone/menaquinone biosynthesis C-methylase UbiE